VILVSLFAMKAIYQLLMQRVPTALTMLIEVDGVSFFANVMKYYYN
jgi:hypothetical protein